MSNFIGQLKFKKLLIFLVYNLVATFILLEIAVRIWGYSKPHIYDPIYIPFEASEDIPYVHKSNLERAHARGDIWINTDALGLRSLVPGESYNDKQSDEYRIAVIGDSVTFGEGVATEETFPQIIEDVLNTSQEQLRVKVFNFGVSGYSVKEMAATLQHRVLDIDPDLVVMSIIFDDLNLGRTGEVGTTGYIESPKASGYLNKGSIVKSILRKVHLIYPIRDVVYRFQASRNRSSVLADGRDNIDTDVLEAYSYIIKFKNTANRYNVQYVVVTLPSGRMDFQSTDIFKKFQNDDINYYDVSEIKTLFTEDAFRVSKFDGHPSALVHKRIGYRLGTYILENFVQEVARE